MPLDAVLLSIAVGTVFLVFAGVLAWADHSTSNGRPAQPAEKQPQAPVRKRAA